ncbi:MAG: peptide chain release factor N(5)-glutamine methyltransferase [Patescibacteria group bacterium]|jgi:release factor glutamine methyltransferase
MISILEALAWGEQALKKTAHEKVSGGHHAKMDAQALLCACLKHPTSYLFSHGNDLVNAEDFVRYERWIERRGRHEPVAYLLGSRPFLGRTFFVNPDVLIPRPETELLAQLAIDHAKPHSILMDIGTGSGAIAVSVAAETGIPTLATDCSAPALAVAKENVERHQLKHLITCVVGDLLDPLLSRLPEKRHHLLITANLPYLPFQRRQEMDPDVYHYEPELALFAGIDGLELYDQLLRDLSRHRERLPDVVELLIEIDPSQSRAIERLIHDYFPGSPFEIFKDYSGQERIVITTI